MSNERSNGSLSAIVLQEMKSILETENLLDEPNRETAQMRVLIGIQHNANVRDTLAEHFICVSYPHLRISTLMQLKAFDSEKLLEHFLWFEKRYVYSRFDYARGQLIGELESAREK